jgi:hypothetical protein
MNHISMGERKVLGLSEQVVVFGNNENSERSESLKARIDSGAITSSLDINIANQLSLGPVTKMKIVKSASGVKERPFVKVRIKIHDVLLEDEFTLVDRGHMTYPILIGQNILKKGEFMIDPLMENQK